MKKIIKLFGIKILEVDTYQKDEEVPTTESLLDKLKPPKGEILSYSPEEEEKDRERETLKKMEGEE